MIRNWIKKLLSPRAREVKDSKLTVDIELSINHKFNTDGHSGVVDAVTEKVCQKLVDGLRESLDSFYETKT